MTIHMQNIERLTLAEMQEFVKGSGRIGLSVERRAAAYGLIQRVLAVQQYARLGKAAKGIVLTPPASGGPAVPSTDRNTDRAIG